MNKEDRESKKNRTTSRARVEYLREYTGPTLNTTDIRADYSSSYSRDIRFLLSIIDKQEGRIKDLEEAYDDAFPYGWGGI